RPSPAAVMTASGKQQGTVLGGSSTGSRLDEVNQGDFREGVEPPLVDVPEPPVDIEPSPAAEVVLPGRVPAIVQVQHRRTQERQLALSPVGVPGQHPAPESAPPRVIDRVRVVAE